VASGETVSGTPAFVGAGPVRDLTGDCARPSSCFGGGRSVASSKVSYGQLVTQCLAKCGVVPNLHCPNPSPLPAAALSCPAQRRWFLRLQFRP